MIAALVVEDDSAKLRAVVRVLRGLPAFAAAQIDEVRTAVEAKRRMRERRYHLLVLDVALPERPEDLPDREGGTRLLGEILERDVYLRPRHIVGLTGYAEVMEDAGRRFAEDVWLVLHYDPASEAWEEQLRRKARHVALVEGLGAPEEHGSHLCVLTALYEPELTSVLRLPWNWHPASVAGDSSSYHRGWFERDGLRHEVVAAAAPRMGLVAAAISATRMIHAFRPRYLAMAGIMAGVRGECELGDIVAADPGWDYGSGKRLHADGARRFAPAPHQINLDSFVRGKLALMARDQAAMDEIQRGWQGPAPPSRLRMRVGPVASGAAVLADPEATAEVRQQHRKVLGVEMEAYGVLAAAAEATLPAPKAFVVKSVCDFADSAKDDSVQAYAAHTSAAALRFFVERYL